MPATNGGSGTAVVLGHLLRAIVGIFDSFSVAWAAKRLCTESVRHGSAHVINHFVRYHLGVYATPVPLMLERFAKPGNAIEDYRLHFHASRTVGIPNGFNPEVEVDILTVLVDVGIPADGRWEVEVIGCGPFPSFRKGLRPGCDKEVN